MPWNVTLNPFIIAQAGRPFNITQGNDINRDALFTERPTFGQLQSRCNELNLTASFCNVGSRDPNAIIPRNFGTGPSYFSVNMRVGRNFGFGHTAQAQGRTGDDTRGSGRSSGGGIPAGGMGGGGMVRGGGPGGGPGGGFGGGGDTRKPYNLNVGINFNNLFNKVNFSTPVGALNSSRFGQSVSTAGGFGGFGGGGFGGSSAANRRIELQLRFSW